MQMGDEIAHLRIVDGGLRLGFPRDMSRGVIRKQSDDLDLGEVAKLGSVDMDEFAAENEVKELSSRFRAHEIPLNETPDAIVADPTHVLSTTLRARSSYKRELDRRGDPGGSFPHLACAASLLQFNRRQERAGFAQKSAAVPQ